MDRQRRQPGNTDRLLRFYRGNKKGLGDSGSQKLAKLSSIVGNDQAMAMVSKATGQRDALLNFVRERLQKMQMAQQAEMKEMKDRPDWWRLVGQGKPGFKLPDPTRWRKPAEMYRKVAEALCTGNLGRAAHLMDQAVEAERLAFESMPTQVQLPSSLTAPSGAPDERSYISEGEGCPTTSAPDVLAAADSIIRTTDHMPDVTTPWLQKPHYWWETEEDEDDPKKKKGGDKKGGKTEAQPEAAKAEKQPEAAKEPEKKVEKEAEKQVDGPEFSQEIAPEKDPRKRGPRGKR